MIKKLILSVLALTAVLPTHGTDSWWKTAQDYEADAIASFIIPASINYYFMSKETPEELRKKARAIVDLYKTGGSTSMGSLKNALVILDLDNKALANTMWWEKMVTSTLVGMIVSNFYLALKINRHWVLDDQGHWMYTDQKGHVWRLEEYASEALSYRDY